eukprot:TRINITY_DN934_c0_g1_i1.p1 TRINITY_DN934_c0_g1~~TRINITY_DN934_c0_g1_i1.p1  ORF type:complete len:245 (-),score=59.48 TRINITY_DN934_c0_g1_i1:1236-1970(-)
MRFELRVKSLNSEKNDLQNQLDTASTKLKRTREKMLEQTTSKDSDLKVEVEDLHNQVSSLESQLKESEGKAAKYRQKMEEEMVTYIKDKAVDHQKLELEKQALHEEIRTLRAALQRQAEAINEQDPVIHELEDYAKDAELQIQKLDSQVHDLEHENFTLRERVQQVRSELLNYLQGEVEVDAKGRKKMKTYLKSVRKEMKMMRKSLATTRIARTSQSERLAERSKSLGNVLRKRYWSTKPNYTN